MNNNIACLLPLYINDNAHYLKLAIESLVNQPCKLILLCDGPIKDEHEKILQQYNSKIEILRFSANRGLAAVLNDGIRYALENGFEFIARMDADDIALPDRIASQYTFLTANPQIDVVGGAIEEIDENSLPTGKIVSYPLTHEACFKFFSARDPLAHPAVMFRKTFFEKAGLYNEAYRKNQDTQLWFAGFKAGCIFANLPTVVLQFRITQDLFKSRRSGWRRAYKMLLDRWQINRELNYGIKAYLYALGMFLITIAPSHIRRWAYKTLR